MPCASFKTRHGRTRNSRLTTPWLRVLRVVRIVQTRHGRTRATTADDSVAPCAPCRADPVAKDRDGRQYHASGAGFGGFRVAAAQARHWLVALLFDLGSTLIPAIVIALVIHVFLAQATRVYGQSMEPNLHTDQRLVIEKRTYRFHGPDVAM